MADSDDVYFYLVRMRKDGGEWGYIVVDWERSAESIAEELAPISGFTEAEYIKIKLGSAMELFLPTRDLSWFPISTPTQDQQS